MINRKYVLLLSLISVIVCFRNYEINAQSISQSQTVRIEDFAVSVFNTIKENDFNTFINLLPKPPYTISFVERGRQESITIGISEFEENKKNLQFQFNSIIETFISEGVSPQQKFILDKIITEYDRDNNFQTIEIYLVIITDKGKYRIRIEDCFIANGKYLPEQLKWVGQKEYIR